MIASTAQQAATDRETLERFVVNNPDLERLETLLDQFNIFEAIGVVRQEARHSDFLAFLLNPQQNHGLGDVFLKSLLQNVLLSARCADLPINLIQLDVWSFDEAVVLREFHSIDILVLDEAHKLAVLIENKVDSFEHSDQLSRYYEVMAANYPGWGVIPLFLTRDGTPPSDERYLPIDYGMIAALTDEMCSRRASTLGADIKTLMTHYAQMLRRHIVSESEIAELCRSIYRRHQRALDLIFESRPNFQDEALGIIEGLVGEFDGLVIDKRTSTWLAFAPVQWDTAVGTNESAVDRNWSVARRILLFWVDRNPAKLRLVLEVLPGREEVRQRLFEIAWANKPPFSPASKELPACYCRIWSRVLAGKDWQEKYSVDELAGKLREQWSQFLTYDLPQLRKLIEEGLSDSGD